MSMKPMTARAAGLLLVGVLVIALALYTPETGAALAAASSVVALLVELTHRGKGSV